MVEVPGSHKTARGFYHGRQQVNAAKPSEDLKLFPEDIIAAWRDIAFGTKAYYRATTGEHNSTSSISRQLNMRRNTRCRR